MSQSMDGRCEGQAHSEQGANLRSLIDWIKHLQIKPQLKLLMRSLADYYGANGKCFPSIRRLAAEICVSRATIHRWINQLEQLGLIVRQARYRSNGGKTSNLYRFMRHGYVSAVRQQENSQGKNKHAAKQNAPSKKIRKTASTYRIDAESMKTPEVAQKNYITAIQQKWITSSSRDRVSYFAVWAKCVRQWRSQKIANPAAMLVHVIKNDLLHKFPTEQDESKALQILRKLRQDGLALD